MFHAIAAACWVQAVTSVYLVDDHPLMRDALRTLLSAHQYSVVGESDHLDEALTEIRELLPDILLLELSLGKWSGLDLQEQIYRQRLPVRTIVLTVDANAIQAAEAHRLGVAGFVFKGTTGNSLLQAIEVVVRGARCWRPKAEALLDRASQTSPFSVLSPREMQIVHLVVRGLSSAAIGERLFLSPKTVDTYRSRLMAKLGVNDVANLVRMAIREGLIGLEDS